jgi:UPF0755 protein
MLRFLSLLSIAALLAAGVLAGYGWWFMATPIPLGEDKVAFTIAPGSGLRGATRQMHAAGIRVQPLAFEALARVEGRAQDIKAGSYELTRGARPADLLDKITRGDFALTELRFIEGWTFRQLRDALDAHVDLRHETRGLTDMEIMRRIGAPELPAEGWFFPDTYRFAKQSSDLDLLKAAHAAMRKHLSTAWGRRAPDSPLRTEHEALVLASIIEKETGRPEDRGRIAGVFVNRLRAGMRLQTDPTVIYGMGPRFDGNLRRRDLEADTPWNTYTRDGLPPTPIAMPGLASLEAATRPEATDALYFVARGDGSSEFSRSLSDHNRAVRKYQLGGR